MVMKFENTDFPYENLTRRLTAEERAMVSGVKLNEEDVDRLVEKFRNSITQASGASSGAVQDDMTMNAEITVRLSRNVVSADQKRVEELVERTTVSEVLHASKIFKN
jgi:hypothetical protein